jgi:SAM-dependent methyltransferase
VRHPVTVFRRLAREARVQSLTVGHSRKERGELRWWVEELPKFEPWYRGEIPELWGVRSPTDEQRVTGRRPLENAIWTMCVLTSSSSEPSSYPGQLLVSPTQYAGKTLLDIGCGGLPKALGFKDCSAYGVDPLINAYRAIGFPMESFSRRLTYLQAPAERVPVSNAFFEAVISVNAIDHVSDFSAVAKEIRRVLKPGGTIRLQAHYHKPTPLEPHSLEDELILREFGSLGVRKVAERRVKPGEQVHDFDECLVVWANDSDVMP